MIPAIIIILIGYNPMKALIMSQVVLSFTLPFAIIPLVILTSKRKLMKDFTNNTITKITLTIFAITIIILNIVLLVTSLI